MSKEKKYDMLGHIVSLLMTVPAMYGTLVDLLKKLNSDNAAFWIFALKKMLRKERPPAFLEVWREIELGGNFRTPADVENLVKASGLESCSGSGRIDSLTWKLKEELEKIDFGQGFDLVIYTASDLVGEKRKASLEEICAAADWIGLKRCSNWMAPKLRLDYQDQPKGEQLLMVTRVNLDYIVFYIGREDEKLYVLHSIEGCNLTFEPDAKYIFIRPRTK
ncbi:MAG: hypothetical protein PHZ04_04530 [Patescibacteria group bacterium]|nr:hypothetical protein [Patescibacteria group bacterium]MDD5294401.1 hypothetical protein [Patescibacteria group bacterium]MDD5554824.1 hypothetical protein [Patescibacteria group bacterium]